jgi:hypothetical protein
LLSVVLILVSFSCSTNRATLRTQVGQQNTTGQQSPDAKPQKLVFRSATINAALTNYAITNRPDFQYKTLTQEYQQKYEKTTALGKEFPVSKINMMSASNLMNSVFFAIQEKGVGRPAETAEIPGSEFNPPRMVEGKEKEALLDILRLSILKNPYDVGRYIGVGMFLSGLVEDQMFEEDESVADFIFGNIQYGLVKNQTNSHYLGLLLPTYLAYVGVTQAEELVIYEDQLKVAVYPSTRIYIYADMFSIYISQKDMKSFLALIDRINDEDMEALLYFKGQLIPIIFEKLSAFGRDDLVIKFWEKKYKKLYLENMDKSDEAQSGSFWQAINKYCWALRNKGLNERALNEAKKLKDYNLNIDEYGYKLIINEMSR